MIQFKTVKQTSSNLHCESLVIVVQCNFNVYGQWSMHQMLFLILYEEVYVRAALETND